MKNISFTIVILLLSIGSYGQTHLGIKGGVNFSGFSSESNFGFQVKFGWHGGVAAKTYIGELGYFLQAEALYQKQGNQNHHLDYLKIPVLVGFDFGVDLNVHLGLYYGYQVSKNENFISSDWGAVLGMDFYTTKRITTTLRLDFGFKNIVSEEADLNFTSAKNVIIDISVTYLLKQ